MPGGGEKLGSGSWAYNGRPEALLAKPDLDGFGPRCDDEPFEERGVLPELLGRSAVGATPLPRGLGAALARGLAARAAPPLLRGLAARGGTLPNGLVSSEEPPRAEEERGVVDFLSALRGVRVFVARGVDFMVAHAVAQRVAAELPQVAPAAQGARLRLDEVFFGGGGCPALS